MLDQLIEQLPPAKKKRRAHVPCPQTVPLVHIPMIAPGFHMLSFSDEARSGHRKAEGAMGLQVFIAVTDRAYAALEEARRLELVTRMTARIAFDHKDDGMVATYYARWVSRRGETGPWSIPVSMRIAV